MLYRFMGGGDPLQRLRVSEIGFGCGNTGGLMVRGSHEEQVQAVRRALDLGITHFDTAPSYGDGLSETNLGRVLAGLRQPLTVATKVSLRGDDLKDIRGAVRRSLEASLQRLGRPSVSLLQLHTQVSTDRGGADGQETLGLHDVLGKDGVADAFDAVRSQGLTQFVGFTGMGETHALHQVIDSGRFDMVQAYYNLLNPSAGMAVPPGFPAHDFDGLIDRAAERDMGVAVIRVMAGGALAGPEARQGHATPTMGHVMVPGGEYEADVARAEALDFLIAGDVASRSQAAVRFALMHPGVSTVLVGFSDLAQIEETTACSGIGLLPEAAMERLRVLWADDFGRG